MVGSSFVKSISGKKICFELENEAIFLKQYQDSSPSLLSKYKLIDIPEKYALCFSNLTQFFQEIENVVESKLYFYQGELIYSMPIATKTISLIIPFQKLPLTEQENLKAENSQLREEISRLKAALQQKCRQNQRQHLLNQQRIKELQAKISSLFLISGQMQVEQEKKNGVSAFIIADEQDRLKRSRILWHKQNEPTKKRKGSSGQINVLSMEKFNFQPDQQHQNASLFEWKDNRLKFLGPTNFEYQRIISTLPINDKGKTSIEFKLTKDIFNSIFFGILSQKYRYDNYSKIVNQGICFNLQNHKIYLKTDDLDLNSVCNKLSMNDHIQILINRESNSLTLFQNEGIVFSYDMEMKGNYYVFVCMRTKGSEIQFL